MHPFVRMDGGGGQYSGDAKRIPAEDKKPEFVESGMLPLHSA